MKLPALAHTRVTAEPEFKAKDLSAELYYYLFSLLSIYLWCVSLWYMYTCEFASVHTSGGQERTLSDLLNCYLPYSFETGSLTKPKAKPEGSKPQQSSCICSSSVLGF